MLLICILFFSLTNYIALKGLDIKSYVSQIIRFKQPCGIISNDIVYNVFPDMFLFQLNVALTKLPYENRRNGVRTGHCEGVLPAMYA